MAANGYRALAYPIIGEYEAAGHYYATEQFQPKILRQAPDFWNKERKKCKVAPTKKVTEVDHRAKVALLKFRCEVVEHQYPRSQNRHPKSLEFISEQKHSLENLDRRLARNSPLNKAEQEFLDRLTASRKNGWLDSLVKFRVDPTQ